MKSDRWVKTVALAELVSALFWHGVYLFGWYAREATEFDAWMVFLAIEGIFFLTLPLASVIGVFLNKWWAYYTLMIFPALAFIHGISAIPYLSHIAPIGHWRSAMLVIINGGLIYFIHRLKKWSVRRHA